MAKQLINRVFVYGTLKQGERNECVWPAPPVSVQPACLIGLLYDLGSYPAMCRGDDLVAGEVWTISPEDMPATLKALDRLEGYRCTPRDLYERKIVSARVGSEVVDAYAYFFMRPERLAQIGRLIEPVDGIVSWHAATESVM